MSVYNAEKRKVYRIKNLERVRTWDRARYQRRKASGWIAEKLERNAQKTKEYKARYRVSPHGKAITAAWKLKNADKIAAQGKRFRKNHHEMVRAFKLAWYHKTKHKYVEHYRSQRAAHAEQRRANAKARRALKKGATVNLKKITDFMKSVKSRPAAICYYCRFRFQSSLVHFDHIIPLSSGGLHSVENLCVACPKCNLSKSDKPIAIFIQTGQQLFSL